MIKFILCWLQCDGEIYGYVSRASTIYIVYLGLFMASINNYIHFSEMWKFVAVYIDGLVQEWRNPSAVAMELHISCINPSIWD